MSIPREKLRVVAAALAEGRTQQEAADLVHVSRRTVAAWVANDLLPDTSDDPATALDGLRVILTDPTLATRDRIAALSALTRAEALLPGAEVAPRVANLTFPAGCPECSCPRCAGLRATKPLAAYATPADCKSPHVHNVTGHRRGRNVRECGCPPAVASSSPSYR